MQFYCLTTLIRHRAMHSYVVSPWTWVVIDQLVLYSPKHDYYFNINLELDFFNIVTNIFFRFYWAFNVSKSNITKNMKSKHLNKCIQVWSSSRQIYISCDIVQQVIIFFPQVISDLQTFSKISSFIIKTLGNTTLFLGKIKLCLCLNGLLCC